MKKQLWFLLAVLSLFILIPANSLACTFCKSSGKNFKKTPPPSASSILGGAKVLKAAKTPGTGFSDGFFASVGKEGEDDSSTQPVAVPNGDDGSYKLIFR